MRNDKYFVTDLLLDYNSNINVVKKKFQSRIKLNGWWYDDQFSIGINCL